MIQILFTLIRSWTGRCENDYVTPGTGPSSVSGVFGVCENARVMLWPNGGRGCRIVCLCTLSELLSVSVKYKLGP